jgi:hypothetical protein
VPGKAKCPGCGNVVRNVTRDDVFTRHNAPNGLACPYAGQRPPSDSWVIFHQATDRKTRRAKRPRTRRER